MPARSIYTQIKGGVTFYRNEAEFAEKGGVGKLGNPALPYKPWRDIAAMPVQTGWNFWSVPVRDLSYMFIARNPDNTPKLTPIDSPDFLRTYGSTSIVNAYRERKFHPMVSRGVPYLVPGLVTAANWDINFYTDSGQSIDYPIELRTDCLLVSDPTAPGGVSAWQYQEFLDATKAPLANSTETKKRLLEMANYPLSDDEFCLAAIVLLQSWQQPLPVPPPRTLI